MEEDLGHGISFIEKRVNDVIVNFCGYRVLGVDEAWIKKHTAGSEKRGFVTLSITIELEWIAGEKWSGRAFGESRCSIMLLADTQLANNLDNTTLGGPSTAVQPDEGADEIDGAREALAPATSTPPNIPNKSNVIDLTESSLQADGTVNTLARSSAKCSLDETEDASPSEGRNTRPRLRSPLREENNNGESSKNDSTGAGTGQEHGKDRNALTSPLISHEELDYGRF